jgi:protein-tyrosine phosphatase
MIDLHSHFLSGIDDGARSPDMTERMLGQAVECGITSLVATPHINRHTTQETELLIRSVFDEVQDFVLDQVLPVHLTLAAEVNITADHEHVVASEWSLIGLKQKYMLFELPLRGIPENTSQIIFDLGLQDVITIMAHPERNQQLQEEPHWLIKWNNQGCLMQMDAGSITGQFGRQCRDFSMRLLKYNLVHCVASDAHNDSSRSYRTMKEAYTILQDHFPSDYVEKLFIHTPKQLLQGELIEPEIRDPDLLNETFMQKMLRFLKYGL